MTAGNNHRPIDAGTAGLNSLLMREGLPTLAASIEDRFDTYLSLIVRWNARINLTAVREPDEIVSRHFVESVACAAAVR